MKKIKKSNKTGNRTITRKIGLGIRSAAALGMVLGSTGLLMAGDESTQPPKDTNVAQPVTVQRLNSTAMDNIYSARPVTVISTDLFLKNFNYTLNASEAVVSQATQVQAAFTFLSQLDANEQFVSLADPDNYVKTHDFPAKFGIQPGTFRQDGIQNPQVGVLVKNLRASIANRLANPVVVNVWGGGGVPLPAGYCW